MSSEMVDMIIGYSTRSVQSWVALPVVALLLSSACRREIPIPIAGTPVNTEKIRFKIKQSPTPLTIVHIWATWCQPCREEFPELVRVYNNYKSKGIGLILISADNPDETSEVDEFLQTDKSPVGSLIAIELDQDFIEALSPEWSGALPASFFFGTQGMLLAQWDGKRRYEEYAETIETLLNQTSGGIP
jgi:thiol-disulfide isomerase/thioredoxin